MPASPNQRLAAMTLTPALALAALIAGAVAMGISPVFVRHAEVGPFVSAFWRVTTALPVLAVWAWFETRSAAKTGTQARRLTNFSQPVLLAGLFFAGDLTFWHLSILNTTMVQGLYDDDKVIWPAA